MITIWKYPIQVVDRQMVKMPHSAKIICAKMQFGQLCLWAEVTDQPVRAEDREIMIVGTGHPITSTAYKYIESVVDGNFVWHIFEVL
jgi:hypothetical protein